MKPISLNPNGLPCFFAHWKVLEADPFIVKKEYSTPTESQFWLYNKYTTISFYRQIQYADHCPYTRDVIVISYKKPFIIAGLEVKFMKHDLVLTYNEGYADLVQCDEDKYSFSDIYDHCYDANYLLLIQRDVLSLIRVTHSASINL